MSCCPEVLLMCTTMCCAGAMMVGHERFCSLEQGCKPCPICNGTVRLLRVRRTSGAAAHAAVSTIP